VRKSVRKPNADCPDCDWTLYFEILPNLGQQVFCPICDTALEVIHKDPLILDWAVDHDPDDPYGDEESLAYFYDEHLEYTDYGDEMNPDYRGGQNGHNPKEANLDD
jgi:hypothetical protein